MKNIISLFYRVKKEGREEKEEKIKLYLNKNSNQFYLEDGYELRNVENIKKSHAIEKEEILVMETIYKNKSIGRRKLENFEIPAFIIDKEREKNFDISFYFFKKRKIKRNKSYLISKKYSVHKNRFLKQDNKIYYEKNLKIKRNDNENYRNFKFKIFSEKISFQEIEKNGVTTQLPFFIIDKIFIDKNDPNLIILKTHIINYSILFKNEEKAKKVFLIISEKYSNCQKKNLVEILEREIQKSSYKKIENFLDFRNLEIKEIFKNKKLRKIFFEILFEKNNKKENIEIFTNSNTFLQNFYDNKNEKILKSFLIFFLKNKIIILKELIINHSRECIEKSIIESITNGNSENFSRRTASLNVTNVDLSRLSIKIEKNTNFEKKGKSLEDFNNFLISDENLGDFDFNKSEENSNFDDKEENLETSNFDFEEENLKDYHNLKNSNFDKKKEDFINSDSEQNGIYSNLEKNEENLKDSYFEDKEENMKNLNFEKNKELFEIEKIEDLNEEKFENILKKHKIEVNNLFFKYINEEIENYLLRKLSKSEFICRLIKKKMKKKNFN